jgi:hypothetical protein
LPKAGRIKIQLKRLYNAKFKLSIRCLALKANI